MSTRARPQVAVFLSGGGRTFTNIHDRTKDGSLSADIAVVVASRECKGAELARSRGIPVRVLPGAIDETVLERLLKEYRIDWIVLAGYLHRLSILPAYAGRVVNIHPALLPRHAGPGMYGLRVHRAVLAAGETVTGCTVHLCDDVYDNGPIVLQRRCPVLPGDTPESLAARVFELEKEAYPEAIAQLLARSCA